MTVTQTSSPAISPTGDALRRTLDGPFHGIKQRWRDEVSGQDMNRPANQTMAEARQWVLDRVLDFTHRDFVTAGFPAQYGGTGTLADSVANFEMMAMGDLSTTIKSGVQHGLFGGAITNLGTEYHHRTFLPDAIAGKLLGCFAMTELNHGSDVQNLETTITYLPESQEFEVHTPHPLAAKAYIGNAGQDGRMAVVFGQLSVDGEQHGVHAILVPIRDIDGSPLEGVITGDQGHKGGLLGVDNGTLQFDHVRVDRAMLLDRFGGVDDDGRYHSEIEKKSTRFFTMVGTLVRGRICVGGGAVSATRKALTIATRYAMQRRQFRRPNVGDEITLLEYQAHQRKLLPAIAEAYAYGFAQNQLALRLQQVHDAGQPATVEARELETRAAGMKALLTRWANDTLQMCRESCGGAGFISENGLTQPRHDADVFATFEGDNTVLQLLVAKALLLDYKSTWGDLDLRKTAQKTAVMVGGTILERTTARALIDRLVTTATLTSESAQLRSRGWHVQMLEFRERHIVESLARRMRAAGRTSADAQFDAINATQEHMVAAARAHTERVVLEAFIQAIDTCEDDYISALLNKVCDLYALRTIESDRAWFMEHNGMDAKRSKAVQAEVTKLCKELVGSAAALVEGLGVPTEWLNSRLV